MVQDSGSGWSVSADTHKEMLLALYIRDLAAIESCGSPSLAALSPKVKPVSAREMAGHSTGELRQEWQSWWERIISDTDSGIDIREEPDFADFSDSPSLQHLLRAHYGSAYTWTQSRLGEYQDVRLGDSNELVAMVAQLLAERELEGTVNRGFHLKLVELPLAERRAWFVEPDTVILSQELIRDATLFRSYLEPIVDLLF